MDPKELRGLYEAYTEVYAPQQIDEISQKTATRAFAARATDAYELDDNKSSDKADKTKERIVKKFGKSAGQHAERAAHRNIFGRGKEGFTKMPPKPTNEELDIFDTVLEFLQVEGYAETLEDAEWLMSNIIDEEAIGIIVELTGGKGHPGYKAGSKDLGPMDAGHSSDSEKRKDKGGTMSMRHGYHLGDIDDKDDDEDEYESIVKQQSRDSRERVRKPLRTKVRTARKVLSKEQYVDEAQAARNNPEGSKKDYKHSAQPDPSKDGFTGIGNMSIAQIKKMNAKIAAKEEFESWLDEAMSSYEKNRQRAAQRAAARNEARASGKTGNVPGVGYVSPRKERETFTDERGQERHKSGARMP